jgi:DNA-binding transcriptional regulator YiaG
MTQGLKLAEQALHGGQAVNTTSAALLERTPRQALEALEEGMGLSEDELAQALGTRRRTVQRWRTGMAYPQQAARQRLVELLNLSTFQFE